MDNLHRHLLEQHQWYANWHKKNHSHAVHWAVLLIVLSLLFYGVTNFSRGEESLFITEVKNNRDQNRKDVLISLNKKVRSAVVSYRVASHKEEAFENLKKALAERKEMMIDTIKKHPEVAISQALSTKEVSELPAEVRALVESKTTITGVFENIQYDGLEHEGAIDPTTTFNEYYIKGKNNVRLHFVKTTPTVIKSGSSVNATGILLNSEMALSDVAQSITNTTGINVLSTPVATTQNTRSALVIVVNPTDATVPYTAASVTAQQAMMFGATNSVKSYFEEQSYGQMTFTGQVVGPYTITTTSSAICDFDDTISKATIAATNAGVSTTSYNHIVVSFPSTNCPFSGIATLGSIGSTQQLSSLINGRFNLYIVPHELGHNLGLNHAKSLICVGGGVSNNTSNCSASEYGDNKDVMGYSNGKHFNAINKLLMGWLTTTNVKTITADGDYFIEPYETVTGGVKALKYTSVPIGQDYYVEYRQPIGHDAPLSGVILHINNVPPIYYPSVYTFGSHLIDYSLPVGATFTDSFTGTTFKNLSETPSGAVVKITRGNIVDSTPPSNVTLAFPTNNSVVAGSIPIKLSINASDNVQISKVEFYQGNLLLGSNNMGYGEYAPFSWIWNTVGIPNGQYSLSAKAYDPSGNVSTTAPVVVNVQNDNVPPEVTITLPSSNAIVSGDVILAARALDEFGIDHVEFYVTNQSGTTVFSSSMASPYSGSTYRTIWSTTSVPIPINGVYNFQAVAYDVSGSSTRSAIRSFTIKNGPSISITTPSAGATVKSPTLISATSDASTIKVEFYYGNILIGTDTVAPYSMYWKTTVSENGAHILTAKAYDSAGNLGVSPTVSVTVDNSGLSGGGENNPPTSILTTPINGQVVAGTIPLSATATDDYGVAKVEFFRGTMLVGTDTTTPYSISWDTRTAPNGAYAITAKAYDASNSTSTSSPALVTISNTDTIQPTVGITSPINNASVARSTAISVVANAEDNVGVARVEFVVNGTTICTDSFTPYVCAWNVPNAPNKTYTLTAKAYDAAGNMRSSTPITVKSTR